MIVLDYIHCITFLYELPAGFWFEEVDSAALERKQPS